MSTYLLEIGTEELPAKFANSVINQFKSSIHFEFDKRSMKFEKIICSSTPRRIVVLLEGLVDFGEDKTEYRKGPKAEFAFSNGSPTKSAIGFAKSLGLDVNDLEIRNTKKGEFVFGKKVEKGLSTRSVLTEIIPKVINSLQGQRFMKWSYGNFKFSRPIRWIVSLYNREILNFSLNGIEPKVLVSNKTYGNRLNSKNIEITNPLHYFTLLEQNGILADREKRKNKILDQINTAAKKLELYPDLDENLLNELTDLVENPNVILGDFDKEYLNLPAELLCTVMKNHQRYIPLLKQNAYMSKLRITSEDILSTKFLLISNGLKESDEIILEGNEKVIKARFADAGFFLEADKNTLCEKRVKKTEDVNYIKGLGNINQRVKRIEHIALRMFNTLEDPNLDIDKISDSAKYCKNDLCSEIVYEFPELQGIMGGKYLKNEGFSEEVSLAVAEHYLPRFYKDILPSTKYGAILSVSDKLETIISIFVIGKRPSGSSDPFALRRNLNGLIQIIWHYDFNIRLDSFIDYLLTYWVESIENLKFDKTKVFVELIEFTKQRILSHLDEIGLKKDLIDALCNSENIPSERILDILDLKKRTSTLERLKLNNKFEEIRNVISRVVKLANNGDLPIDILTSKGFVNTGLFEKESEENIFKFVLRLEELIKTKNWDYQQLIELFEQNLLLVEKIFDNQDGVLIMSDDIDLKNNRINLLSLIRNYSLLIADFTLLNS